MNPWNRRDEDLGYSEQIEQERACEEREELERLYHLQERRTHRNAKWFWLALQIALMIGVLLLTKLL